MDNNKTLPRDVFLYLLSVITLAVSATSFGTLIFQYINMTWVDAVDYYGLAGSQSAIRYSMASLIIVFPVFVWVSRFLRKDTERHEEKRDLKIRRWLLYFTIFVAALIIIGDLVAILFNFLNGELSTRFVLKALTVLFIAKSIFIHYFNELKEVNKQFSWIRIFDWSVVAVVAISIIAGFWIAGSPAYQRMVRFDEERVNDLTYIQSEVVNYWQRKEALPTRLSDLSNDISGFNPPKDPESGNEYEYRVTGNLSFELCATFGTSNEEYADRVDSVARPYYYGVDSHTWIHDEGRVCFERTIDPDFYPTITKPAPPALQ